MVRRNVIRVHLNSLIIAHTLQLCIMRFPYKLARACALALKTMTINKHSSSGISGMPILLEIADKCLAVRSHATRSVHAIQYSCHSPTVSQARRRNRIYLLTYSQSCAHLLSAYEYRHVLFVGLSRLVSTALELARVPVATGHRTPHRDFSSNFYRKFKHFKQRQ